MLQGIWPHDDAIEVAKKVRLTLNPKSGVAEIIESGEPVAARRPEPPEAAPVVAPEVRPLLAEYGYRLEDLTEGLCLELRFSKRVLTARDEDSLLSIAGSAPSEWQGLAALDLAAGLSIEDINEKLGLEKPTAGTQSDEALIKEFKSWPASSPLRGSSRTRSSNASSTRATSAPGASSYTPSSADSSSASIRALHE